jgi:hypothetical protein
MKKKMVIEIVIWTARGWVLKRFILIYSDEEQVALRGCASDGHWVWR